MKGPSGKTARARNYMFTINYGAAEDGAEPVYEQLTPAIDRWDERGVRYCRWQLEVGAEGVEHIQGYLELTAPQSMIWCHKLPGLSRASFQTRHGSAFQADAYCSKDDTRVDGPWTFGVGLWYFRVPAEANTMNRPCPSRDRTALCSQSRPCWTKALR